MKRNPDNWEYALNEGEERYISELFLGVLPQRR
jgi:hypothetical protein